MSDKQGGGDDSAVEIVLNALELQVANENPCESACEQEAHGDDAGGGGEQPESEAQLPTSSSR